MKKTILVLMLLYPMSLVAQTVTNIQGSGARYTMDINGKPYVALSRAASQQTAKYLNERKELLEKNDKLVTKLAEAQKLLKEQETLREKYAKLTDKYEQQTTKLENLNNKYAETSGDLITLNNDYRTTIGDFDKLVEKYRDVALRSVPRNPVDLAIGSLHNNDEWHTVFMAGAGFDLTKSIHFRGWLFGGVETYGAMVGISF